MKHHQYNKKFQFVVKPMEFNKFSDRDLLQYCLGATLYMPGTQDIVDKILHKGLIGTTSIVMDFEDAIDEKVLLNAEINVLNQLDRISESLEDGIISHDEIPLTFLRVRSLMQFKNFSNKLLPKHAEVLTGFVFPKFYSDNGNDYFECLESLNKKLNVVLYGMPILEGHTIALKETRIDELSKIINLLRPYKDIILNIRVGGTDFSSIFGVRRGINYSIYDILTVRDCLSDILNFFSREGDNWTISGPVWEYFLAYKKDNINNLLTDNIHRSLLTRNPILNEAIDGLMREVILDKANGFIGKTIIHPSHAKYVNAMQAVTREEYEDSIQILSASGGVVKSSNANKMNEINPHKNWAKKIVSRSYAYGVIENESLYLKLFSEPPF